MENKTIDTTTIIINATPHPVNICDADGNIKHTFPKSDLCTRLASWTEKAGSLMNGTVPISKTVFGETSGLPEFKPGTYYIVSQLVKSANPHRSDLLVPAEVVRNEAGVIVGCQSLGV